MMTIGEFSDLAAQGVVLLSCAVVFCRCEPVLNTICEGTCRRIHMAFYLLVVGSVSVIWNVLAGDVPSWQGAILIAGLALLLVCERRVRVFMRAHRRAGRRVAQ